MEVLKDCTSWIKEFYNGSISGKCKTKICMDFPAGRKNRYGHPYKDTLERLENSGAENIFYTENGAFGITVNKKYADSWEKRLNLKGEFSIL